MVGLWYYNQPGVTEMSIRGILIMVRCVLSQLKHSELYILSLEKASAFSLGLFQS